MKKEYQKILAYYLDSEVQNLSKKFLDKYWLDNNEYIKYWLPIEKKIFNTASKDLPDLMFNAGFKLIAQRGGVLFTKEEYQALQKCMVNIGDKYFVFIENECVRNLEGSFPHLRFKFPVNTTWEDLNNGDENFPDISFETMFIMNKHFFVFGESGKWGKYAASDFGDTPLDLIGFKPELAAIFQKHFNQPTEEEIREWLPQEYKKLIK